MIIEDKLVELLVKSIRERNRKIVLVGGCFDILHDGHIEFLKKSKQSGDALVLLLESDENIKKIKGEERPVNNFLVRATALEKLGFIDLIVGLSPNVTDKYYYDLTKLIQPDIIAITKGDPLTAKKKDQALTVNGRLIEVMGRDREHSSTRLINKK